jgi:predicted ATP-grasp superfamily ATP-dependent carboligase
MPAVSIWAAVPHYAGGGPSPKASLALLRRLEELLDTTVSLGDLQEQAQAWEHGVNELADGDAEVGEYVRALEQAKDTTELPEATGEAIAKEFERYLRRRDDDPPPTRS